MPILDRLIGLETEYALRFQSGAGTPSPSRFQLYQRLVDCLKGQVLTAPAKHFKEGVFLANGGAVWFEAERPAAGGGLVEGSTPECRGLHTLLCYQRAQDQLLGESARLSHEKCSFTLIKNDRDGHGHVYGAQENYEAVIGRAWSLLAWRAGLVVLLPILLLTWLGIGVMIGAILIYLALAGLVFLPMRMVAAQPRRVALLLFGRDLVEGRETGSPTPPWLEFCLIWITRIVTGPLAVSLWIVSAGTAFRRTRRDLLPFLASRCALSGAGMVDDDGTFQLADKAPAINCRLGFGGFLKDRPIFTVGHFFKALCAETWLSPKDYFEMFCQRQRLQIGLGDSNMAEVAEFLRIGTTALVLDVIEAGKMPPVPKLRRPIKALHQLCGDPTFTQCVRLKDGQEQTALQLQRFYLEACRQFLVSRHDAPDEAYDVIARWEETLDALDEYQETGVVPASLIGVIDWVTKKHLLDEAGGGETYWSARKKIDICYHELSPTGYFRLLQTAGLTVTLVSPEEIERAIRTAPPHSPATMRSHFMREFSSESDVLVVNWKKVVIGKGRGAKVIRLRRYGRRTETPRPVRNRERQSP